jgi:hypothetical protein
MRPLAVDEPAFGERVPGDLASLIESRRAAWTVEELAAVLSVSTKTLYRKIH